ncbi:hypothetical protein GOP47_0028709 [Adiantum capillus-veneris]|nr:hypothetical protein GOP47_0028709 [Adiantum capillus-veneris]
MKVALLKRYVELEVLAMHSRYFYGTNEKCIKSWIEQVEEEMTYLHIVDDEARVDFSSQGLSSDAFVFIHMLPDDWGHNWLALKFSLLMRYWRLPKPKDPIESSLVATFQSFQNEFWGMLQSPFDVDAYCDDNAYRLSDLHADRGLQMVDEASIKLFDGDDLSESGYCSHLESDDYSASLFSATGKFMDCIPVDGAFTDEGYSCDDSTIFDPSPYTRSIRSGCPDEARNAKEGNQALEYFDVREDSCRETYHKYNACDPSCDACQLTSSFPLATDADN